MHGERGEMHGISASQRISKMTPYDDNREDEYLAKYIAHLRKKLVVQLEGKKMVTPCHQDADQYFNLAVNACIEAVYEIMGK